MVQFPAHKEKEGEKTIRAIFNFLPKFVDSLTVFSQMLQELPFPILRRARDGDHTELLQRI
jgi:hypothetical protein